MNQPVIEAFMMRVDSLKVVSVNHLGDGSASIRLLANGERGSIEFALFTDRLEDFEFNTTELDKALGDHAEVTGAPA